MVRPPGASDRGPVRHASLLASFRASQLRQRPARRPVGHNPSKEVSVTHSSGLSELLTAERGPVIIGIDELDKMSEEDARQFPNDIKTVFGQRDCYYLVSVSEDAMSAFERRGMRFRDVFEDETACRWPERAVPVARSPLLLRDAEAVAMDLANDFLTMLSHQVVDCAASRGGSTDVRPRSGEARRRCP